MFPLSLFFLPDLFRLLLYLPFQCKASDLCWNCDRQKVLWLKLFLGAVAICERPAVLTPMLNFFWQTPGGQDFYNPMHFCVRTCHCGPGTFLPFILLLGAGWVHLHIHLYKATCVRRYDQRCGNTSFPFREVTEDRYCRKREKNCHL